MGVKPALTNNSTSWILPITRPGGIANDGTHLSGLDSFNRRVRPRPPHLRAGGEASHRICRTWFRKDTFAGNSQSSVLPRLRDRHRLQGWRTYQSNGLVDFCLFGPLGAHLDPFGVIPSGVYGEGKKDGLRYPQRGQINPVNFVRSARSPLTAALMVVEALIPPGSLKESHWSDGAKLRAAATLLYVALDPRLDEMEMSRDMDTFWSLLSRPDLERASLMQMLTSDLPIVADQAQTFYKASKNNTELQSIRNHLRVNCTQTLAAPAIMNTLLDDSLDFTRLREEPTTVFVVLPGDMAVTHYRYMRLIVTLTLSYIERSGLYVSA